MNPSLNSFSPSPTMAGVACLDAGWAGFQFRDFPAPAAPADCPSPEEAVKNYEDLLVERILAGEYDAFEQLIERHSRRVLAIARKFFRSPETVEDIAQETFTKAYFSLASYRRGASFEHWLAKIAVNNCYDELRRRRRRGEALLADVTEDQATWLENKLADVSFGQHFGERDRDCAAEIAEKLLSRLSPEARLTLILLHAEEYSVREVAQMMGWTEAKVKIRAFRARHEMRRALERLTLVEKRKSHARTRLAEKAQ